MAVAAQAALLDELMGKGRNVSLSDAKPPHWSDDDMCKYYLAGLCPHELFNNTKDDLGPCTKVHDCSLLNSYRKSKRCGQMRYEEQLCLYLRDLISTVESRIRRGQTRLAKNGNLVHSFYNCEREEVLQDLTEKIEKTLIKVEKLGTDGEVEQSRIWLDVAEKLKNEKVRMEKSIEIYNQQAKELEICQTCGAFQVKGDAHQRIEEHLQGKMHLGYAQIREYLSNHNGKVIKNDKAKMKVSDDTIKSKVEDCIGDNNKSKVYGKVEKEEQMKNNSSHKEEEEDYECSTEWEKEQKKVKESHKEDSKERRRHRSRSKDKHHHSDRKEPRRSHRSEQRVDRHCQSQRRSSKTPKRHVHR